MIALLFVGVAGVVIGGLAYLLRAPFRPWAYIFMVGVMLFVTAQIWKVLQDARS